MDRSMCDYRLINKEVIVNNEQSQLLQQLFDGIFNWELKYY